MLAWILTATGELHYIVAFSVYVVKFIANKKATVIKLNFSSICYNYYLFPLCPIWSHLAWSHFILSYLVLSNLVLLDIIWSDIFITLFTIIFSTWTCVSVYMYTIKFSLSVILNWQEKLHMTSSSNGKNPGRERFNKYQVTMSIIKINCVHCAQIITQKCLIITRGEVCYISIKIAIILHSWG